MHPVWVVIEVGDRAASKGSHIRSITKKRPLLLDGRYPQNTVDLTAPFLATSDLTNAISKFGEIKKNMKIMQ
jgi:hypothetical protein